MKINKRKKKKTWRSGLLLRLKFVFDLIFKTKKIKIGVRIYY